MHHSIAQGESLNIANTDRTHTRAKPMPRNYSFWHCQVYADIRGSSLEMTCQPTLGWRNGDLPCFRSLLL